MPPVRLVTPLAADVVGRRRCRRVPPASAGCVVIPRVRERSPRYEDEGSVREARGAVTLPDGDWWSGALTVPVDAVAAEGAVARITLQRHGAVRGSAGATPDAGVDLLVRVTDLDALVTLLDGVVRQARRDALFH